MRCARLILTSREALRPRTRFVYALTALLVVGYGITAVRAEHRVALLIGNRNYQNEQHRVTPAKLSQVVAALEKFGFACQTVNDLQNESAFRDAVETFATHTPTRSTVFLYYHGQLASGPSLLGVDSRGKYPLAKVMQALQDKGGSCRHVVYLDVPKVEPLTEPLPADARLRLVALSSC